MFRYIYLILRKKTLFLGYRVSPTSIPSSFAVSFYILPCGFFTWKFSTLLSRNVLRCFVFKKYTYVTWSKYPDSYQTITSNRTIEK